MTDTTLAPTDQRDQSEVLATIDVYLAALNEGDVAARTDLVARSWASDGAYTDPLQAWAGHDELVDMVDGIAAVYPGHRFVRTTGIDGHHDRYRFAWELVAPDDTVAVAGIDIAELAADGRLARITGYFGDLPEA